MNLGFLRGEALPHRRVRATATALATVGLAAVAGSALAKIERPSLKKLPPIKLAQPLIDAISGAVGEVSQICMLYPLETIKVRCQADGISAVEVIRRLGQHGFGPRLIQQLYSGFASAALFSMAVGAVHWLSFCAAKRAAMQMVTPSPAPRQKSHLEASSSSSGSSSMAAGAAAVSAAAQDRSGTSASEASAASGQGAAHHMHVSSGHHTHDDTVCSTSGEDDLSRKTKANLIAAALGAIATGLIESPVELFRHQAQAGLISGNLVKEMANSVRTQGPLSLWWGFLPFCLEAFPYDMSELAGYSQLRDTYDVLSKPGGRLHAISSKLPQHVWDLSIGAAAGAGAVMVSMPFDCIKTYMQTHAAGAMRQGVREQVVFFFSTGATMVQRRGPGALFVGIVPRLLQQVPSSMICWWSVEQCQKTFAALAQKE